MWYLSASPCIVHRYNQSFHGGHDGHNDFHDDFHNDFDDDDHEGHHAFTDYLDDGDDDYVTHVISDSMIDKPLEIFLFIFLLTVIIVGVIGNSLILVIVITQRKQRTTSSCYVASLAFTDIIVLLTCGVLHLALVIVPAFNLQLVEFPSRLFTCFTFIHEVSKGVTCYTLVALTIDRYLAIVHPLSSRRIRTIRHAVTVSIVVWFGSLLYTIIIEALNQFINELIIYAIVFITEYIVPLIISTTCYVVIIHKIWRPGPRVNSLRRGSNQGDDEHRRQKLGLLRMVLVAVIVFAVSVGFHHAVHFYILVSFHEENPCRITIWTFLSNIALFVNSAMNPFVYGLTNSLYASAFKSMLCCCNRGPKNLISVLKTIPEIYRKMSGASTTLDKTDSIEMSSVNGDLELSSVNGVSELRRINWGSELSIMNGGSELNRRNGDLELSNVNGSSVMIGMNDELEENISRKNTFTSSDDLFSSSIV